MSRIDAAWKRASGALVDETPAPASTRPAGGSGDPATLAEYVGEETRTVVRLVPAAPPVSTVPAPKPVRAAKPTATPASLRGKLVGTPEIEAVTLAQYKRLGLALHELQIERGIKSLMISSALPREGKTLTVANLALTLGDVHGRQVLVIDADLHRPAIHEIFGIPNDRGLLDALRSADTPLPAVQVTPGVSVVTAGGSPEASTWVRSSDRLRFLLADAAAQYDWILIDTPPVATITDAQFIARATDGILFVIAAGITPYTIIQRCVAELGPDRILGTVLNRVDARVLPVRGDHHNYYA